MEDFCGINGFVPKIHCGGWTNELITFWAISEFIIFLSYVTLSVAFAFIIRRRHHPSIGIIFWLLGIFVLLCGMTHLVGFIILWIPIYKIGAWLNSITAAFSLVACIITYWYIPRVMRVPTIKHLYDQYQELRLQTNNLLNKIADEKDVFVSAAKIAEIKEKLKDD